MDTPVDTDNSMANRDDWRTRYPEDSFEDYSDDDDDDDYYYYDNKTSSYGTKSQDTRTGYDEKGGYNRRDSNSRNEDFFQHEKKEKKKKRKNPNNKQDSRPNSSSNKKDYTVTPKDSKTDTSTKNTPNTNIAKTASTTTSAAGKSLDKGFSNPQTPVSVLLKNETGNTQPKPEQKSNKTPAGTAAITNIQVDKESPKNDLNPQKSISTNISPKKAQPNPLTQDKPPLQVSPSTNKPTDTTKQSTQPSTAGKVTKIDKKSVKEESNPEQRIVSPKTPLADKPQNPAITPQSKTSSVQNTNSQDKTNNLPKNEPPTPVTQDKPPLTVSSSTNKPTDDTKQVTKSSTSGGKATKVENKSVKDETEQASASPIITQPCKTQTQNPANTSNTNSGQSVNSQDKTKISPKKNPPVPATQDKTSPPVPPSTSKPADTSKQNTQSSTAAGKETTLANISVKDESDPEQKIVSPVVPQPQNPPNTVSTQNTNLQGETKKSPKKVLPKPTVRDKTPPPTAPTSPPVIPIINQSVQRSSGNNSFRTKPDDVTNQKIENKNPQAQATPSPPTHPPPPAPPSITPTNNSDTQSTNASQADKTKTKEPISDTTLPKDQPNLTNQSSTHKDAGLPPLLPFSSNTPPSQPTKTEITSRSTNPLSITRVESNTGVKFSFGYLATQPNTLPTQSLVSPHSSTSGNSIPGDNTVTNSEIITQPPHQDILPPQCDITNSTLKELVSTDTYLFDENMSSQGSNQLTEEVKSLTGDLEAAKQKVIQAEANERNTKEEIKTLKEEKDRISKDLEQRENDIVTKDGDRQKVLDDLQSRKQQIATLNGEKSKINKELDAIKKERDELKTQVEHNAGIQPEIDKLNKEKQRLNSKLSELDSSSKKLSKEIAEKEKDITKLKESHSVEIKDLNSRMAQSKEAFAESQSEIKKVTDDRDAKLKQIDNELQTANEARNRLETEKKNDIQEIKQLKEKIGGMKRDTDALKEHISQLEKESKQQEASMGYSADIELISKIEKAFVDLSGLVPPPEYKPGSHERVEWLVASLVSWNADLNGKISVNESFLHEKQTEIETMQGELQAIMDYLQHQMPTNPISTPINSSDPLNLVKSILAGKTEEMSKANDLIRKAESDKQKMEMQIQEISRHYNTEDSKNEQLMQDNAALERQIQTLISEKEELEVKNVELINELSELREGAGNLNSPTTQSKLTNLGNVEGSFNPRPSPLYLETASSFPFDTPMSPPPTALSSLTMGHRTTLQKAADELSHLKVKVWESEAENSKLREQLSAQARDPTLPTNISPDAEGAFQAVFEANQVNLVKLGESTRDKEVLFKDIEFLRQRVEDLEKNAERLKVSIEVKEVAYKELYLECRDWERKYKKCSNVHHELERVKRQLLQKEADSQECATLRAERLNQQTTLDNLGAELQERKKMEQNLKRNNQKLQTRLEDCLRHISNMQVHLQDKPIMKPHKHSQPEEPLQNPPPQEPRPISPTILKPPSMSSAPLSPPTRQPPGLTPFSKHPPILYPPTS